MIDVTRLKQLFVQAVSESVCGVEEPFVLFSGGVDSASIAQVARKANEGSRFVLFGTEESEDVRFARRVAREMNVELVELIVGGQEVLELFGKVEGVLKGLSNYSLMQAELGILLYACCAKAREEGSHAVVTGQGAEELFAGYSRHFQAFQRGENVNKLVERDLANLRETDLNRNELIAREVGVELKCPFLNEAFVREARKIDVNENFSREGGRKLVLRRIARELDVPELACNRVKRAMQYGSGVHKALQNAKVLKPGKT